MAPWPPWSRGCPAASLAATINGIRQIAARDGQRIRFRVGINSGPLVAGVIGKSKFQYDLWGDTVNLASRMESHGEEGRFHVSEATYQLVKDHFTCTPRGVVAIKGKGEMPTWFIERPERSAWSERSVEVAR